MSKLMFRAWDKKTNKMYFVASIDMFGKVVTLLDDRGDTLDFIERAIHNVELMQATGLIDKNGEEIYEGDILNIGRAVYKVVFNDNYAAFFIKQLQVDKRDRDNSFMSKGHINNSEVIGNIYENPEMVK